AAGIAQAFGQARFDGRVAILVLRVQDEGAAAEVVGQRREFALQPGQFVGREHADALQALCMRAARLDVVQEEFTIEDHVVARQEGLDLGVHADAGLLPQQVAHAASACGARGMPANSSKPNARLRFCSAWVAAPLSRLSSVATTTRRWPSSDNVKPPSSTCCALAMRLTQGASSSTRTSGSCAYAAR